jgi:hypothetical protein
MRLAGTRTGSRYRGLMIPRVLAAPGHDSARHLVPPRSGAVRFTRAAPGAGRKRRSPRVETCRRRGPCREDFLSHSAYPDPRCESYVSVQVSRWFRAYPYHPAGRSLRTACATLPRRRPRSAVLAASGFLRCSIGTGNPSNDHWSRTFRTMLPSIPGMVSGNHQSSFNPLEFRFR